MVVAQILSPRTVQLAQGLIRWAQGLPNWFRTLQMIRSADTWRSRVPAIRNWPVQRATNGRGIVFQRPGAVGNADSLRIMQGNARNPDGYFRYYNANGQPLDRFGRPGPEAATHLPLEALDDIRWPW